MYRKIFQQLFVSLWKKPDGNFSFKIHPFVRFDETIKNKIFCKEFFREKYDKIFLEIISLWGKFKILKFLMKTKTTITIHIWVHFFPKKKKLVGHNNFIYQMNDEWKTHKTLSSNRRKFIQFSKKIRLSWLKVSLNPTTTTIQILHTNEWWWLLWWRETIFLGFRVGSQECSLSLYSLHTIEFNSVIVVVVF